MNRSLSTWLAQRRAYLFVVLIALFVAGIPVSARSIYQKRPDRDLFNLALMAQGDHNWLDVATYLTAYIEREPNLYMTNRTHREQVIAALNDARSKIKDAMSIANDALQGRCASVSAARGVFTNPPPLAPLPDEVVLYVDFNYGAGSVVKTVGNYYTAEAIGLPNDSISSLRVGSDVRVYLCMHGGLTGTCETFTGNDPNLSDNAIGNDQVTSIRVERRTSCMPGPNEVALFMHFNYEPPCEVKGVGNYANADQIGLPNDSISSLRVGRNVRAVLCMHGGFTGPCVIFAGDDPNLSDNAIGNDQVTSVRVERR